MTKSKPVSDLSAYPVLLTTNEVAEILRVDRRHVYELIRISGLPVMNLAEPNKKSVYRFPKISLINWIEQTYGVKMVA